MTDFFCSLANTRLVHSCSQFRFILVTVVRLSCGGKGCKGGMGTFQWDLHGNGLPISCDATASILSVRPARESSGRTAQNGSTRCTRRLGAVSDVRT